MLPVEQRAFGNADAAGERALREAGAGADRGDINRKHFYLMDARFGFLAFRECQSFALD